MSALVGGRHASEECYNLCWDHIRYDLELVGTQPEGRKDGARAGLSAKHSGAKPVG